MSRPVIFIAGPFRAATPWLVEQNIRRAEVAALAVAEQDAIPLCPHTMTRFFDRTLTDEYWLEATRELLRRCDGVLFLSDWQRSVGSVGERTEAEAQGLPIFDELDGVRQFVATWTGTKNS